MALTKYKREFIEFCLESKVLCFGQFTLKSGRISPYFFNAGLFLQSGESVAKLGRFYAAAAVDEGWLDDIQVEALFGPAYKGIPLVVATSIALSDHHHRSLPIAFNRKEQKDHGEGGTLVGAVLAKTTPGTDNGYHRILVIDDVMTAGTALRETRDLLSREAAATHICGVLLALDRQERALADDPTSLSAVQSISKEFNVPVRSIITISDIILYLRSYKAEFESQCDAIEKYLSQYGSL